MELRIWKRIYLCPFIRLNLYTRGLTISFGHNRLSWITFGRRGIREILDTPIPGVYLSQGQRWNQLARVPRRLWGRLFDRKP